jgi:hypothetical protein
LEVHHHQCEQEFIVGGVEEKPLVGGVDRINKVQEDLIVYPTLSPYTSMDLGARSLVGGVDCNGPEKSLFFSFVCFLLCIIVTSCILMHL